MEHAPDRLELGAIKAALLERVRTPLGSLEVHALGPFEHLEDAKERVEAIRESRLLLSEQEPPPVEGAQDVRGALSLGEKGVMLESSALRAIADTMRAGSYVRRQLLGYEGKTPQLYGLAAGLPDLIRLADHVSRSFDSDGLLNDDASADLGTFRRRVRALRDKLREQINVLLVSPEIHPYLQENYFTVRADRYVLPIKASFKNEVKGIVHDASGSGQTVFIEPNAVVDAGNRLKIAQSEQTEEEHRILLRLTEMCVAEAEAIRDMMNVVGQIDLIASCARLATELECAGIVPSDRPGFELLGARHPMLLLQSLKAENPINVVANDLGLKPEQQVLVLTGPNTGGKTVAMKTVGLFAIMVRCGLHLPCDERSSIGWFNKIEVAIGDDQSITTNLSTFAAHMKLLMETIARADERTLVLIDEIAADTDPTQGQALAQAILEDLADHGAHVVVTTHFERLKAVPFADRRFRNAGVGFDQSLLRPTYRVTLDMPQSSSGLDIAQGLGLEKRIVDRARSLTGEGSQALEKLMHELDRRQQELMLARRGAEVAEREAAREKTKLQEMQRNLERERETFKVEARKELLKEIEGSREEVRKIIASLQGATETVNARDAMRMAQEAASSIQKIEAIEEEKQRAAIGPDNKSEPLRTVNVGDWVHVKQIGKDGDVVALDGKDAQVAVGNMRMRVPITALLPPRSRRPKPRSSGPEPGKLKKELLGDAKTAKPAAGPAVTEELDLRGHAIEESLDRLDAFLDHHYGTPVSHVRIVHGHGTGALRMAVRAHLKASGYVRSVRPGEDHEGGDGATVVELA
jgi:DNA mismatch repair protein MutS2